MKLCEMAEESIRLLKESGKAGIRSDMIADILKVPRRRVYDVIAVLKALGLVTTTRRINGTTVTWNDPFERIVPRTEHESVVSRLRAVEAARAELQVENAALKEKVRQLEAKCRSSMTSTEAYTKVHFNTSYLRVKCAGCGGFKNVKNAGLEVIIESNNRGMIVDPTPVEVDETKTLLEIIHRL